MQVICRVKAPFSLCGDREEFALAKKLQSCRDFCFHDGWIVSTDGYRRGVTATGQIAQTCVFSAAARAATSRATDRTKRPPGLAGSGWAAARVQRGLPRIGRSGALGLVSSDRAASLGLEATGGGGRGFGRLRRVECRFRRRQRSWLQGLFNAEILYGHWGFGLALRLIGLSGLLFRKVRGGNFALALRSGTFALALRGGK